MNMPELMEPARYTGLYIVDFGEQVAVGYTGPEVEMLLESEQYRGLKAYKIHRALPDGSLELRGVPAVRFTMEDGMIFCRRNREDAKADYDQLVHLAHTSPPPCRMKVHLSRRDGEATDYVTVAIFPAEYSDDVSQWLLDLEYKGGDRAEGGTSQVSLYYELPHEIIERSQLWPAKDGADRSREEVYASTRRAIQR